MSDDPKKDILKAAKDAESFESELPMLIVRPNCLMTANALVAWTKLVRDINKEIDIDLVVIPAEAEFLECSTDLISRKGVSAWLSNMGYDDLATVIENTDRFPPEWR